MAAIYREGLRKEGQGAIPPRGLRILSMALPTGRFRIFLPVLGRAL